MDYYFSSVHSKVKYTFGLCSKETINDNHIWNRENKNGEHYVSNPLTKKMFDSFQNSLGMFMYCLMCSIETT